MDEKEAPHESPATFLAELAKQLSEMEGTDCALASILTAHLLKELPAQNAVLQAKTAIIELAREQAKSSKTEKAIG